MVMDDLHCEFGRLADAGSAPNRMPLPAFIDQPLPVPDRRTDVPGWMWLDRRPSRRYALPPPGPSGHQLMIGTHGQGGPPGSVHVGGLCGRCCEVGAFAIAVKLMSVAKSKVFMD